MYKFNGGSSAASDPEVTSNILGLAYKPRGDFFELVSNSIPNKKTDLKTTQSSTMQSNESDQMNELDMDQTIGSSNRDQDFNSANGAIFNHNEINRNLANEIRNISSSHPDIIIDTTEVPQITDKIEKSVLNEDVNDSLSNAKENSEIAVVVCSNGNAMVNGEIAQARDTLSELPQRQNSVLSRIKRPQFDRSVSFSYFSEQNGVFDQLAVEVQDAHLSYGRGKKIHHALRGITLRVPEGAIYGLLGPSGCGKTTLLNAVIGKLNLKKGQVKVFGERPGSNKSIIPGRGVGFMPQELALYQEFTIEETLVFFGRLHQINPKTLKERMDFLLKFLDLPPRSRLVQNLSGGQQRRVSLAAALIHQPPLLILDEPTVGVDPLLRQNIWNHLVELTSKEGMTVIITTHYIEEARQANVVGLMRKGRLLAEASPTELVQHFSSESLEDCFLKLCMMDKETKQLENQGLLNSPLPIKSALLQRSISNASYRSHRREIDRTRNEEDSKEPPISGWTETECIVSHNTNYAMSNSTADLINGNAADNSLERKRFEIPHRPNSCVDGSSKILTLLSKNLTRLRRNLILLMFQFALPGIQVVLLCLCIGANPFDLKMAVVNHEFPQSLSVGYLESISRQTIIQKPFDDLESAMNSVRLGDTWGVIHIDKNFSRSLMRRFQEGLDVSNETIIGSSIKVYLDMTNQQIGLILQKTLLEAFQNFSQGMLDAIGSTPLLASLPVSMEKPIFGELQSVSFTEFIAPGVVLSITYIMAVGLTSLSFVDERKSGLFDRSWVSGVTSFQVLISHVLTQSIVLVVQVLVILIFTFLVFEIPSRGPFFWVVALTLLQGVCGMSFGLLISSLCSDESTAVMLAMSAFFPNLILCGIVWPLEAQPHFMRYLSTLLPQTLPTEALRAILSRGWGIDYSIVWTGFAVTFGWIAFFLVAAGIIFRFRK